MPSIKQKFAGFLRQLSAPTNVGDILESSLPKSPSVESNACFIQRYLNGESRLKQPDILYGRTGQELPCIKISAMLDEVIAVDTGPSGGLTTVNRGKKNHVTSQDPSLAFIDSEEEPAVSPPARNMDNVVRIRAMGQTFVVRNHPLTTSSTTTTTTTTTTTKLPPISEDSSPSSLSSPTCADQSDYQDFLSKLGIWSHHQSVSQIDSPDDHLSLRSTSTSLAASELTSPVDEPNPQIIIIAPPQHPPKDPGADSSSPQDPLPDAVDIPAVAGKHCPPSPPLPLIPHSTFSFFFFKHIICQSVFFPELITFFFYICFFIITGFS